MGTKAQGGGASRGGVSRMLAGLVCLLLIAVGAWVYLNRPTPEKAAADYLAALGAGDKAAVKALLSEASQGTMGAMMGALIPFPGGQSADAKPAYDVGEAVVTGDKASVPVSIKLPEQAAKMMGMTEVTMHLGLVREDGDWKLDAQQTASAMMAGRRGDAAGSK